MKRALVGTRPRDNKCASSHMTPRRIPLGVHSFSHIVDDHTAQLIRIRPELTEAARRRSSCIRITFPRFTAVIETSNALNRIPPERRTIPRSYGSRTLDPGAILTEIEMRLHAAIAAWRFPLEQPEDSRICPNNAPSWTFNRYDAAAVNSSFDTGNQGRKRLVMTEQAHPLATRLTIMV